jgi:hypothetical protein
MINVEGLILPNESLSNFQLIDAAKKLKIKHFRGVFVRDQLPKKPRDRECGILNTGDSITNGFHWMCWYKNGKVKLCFDSYALPLPVELVDYLAEDPVYYYGERVQYGNTVFCGHLCLYVLKKLDDAIDFQEIINGMR